MKKIITFGIAAILVLTTQLFAQSPYRLEVEQEVIGSDLHMSLYATKMGGSDFAFGSCNFAVYIDTNNLDIYNMSKVTDGLWDNNTDPQSYLDVNLGHGPDFINVSTRRNTTGSGSGVNVPATKTLIAEIAIPIKNQCATNSSSWVIIPAAQNKFPLVNIKPDALFTNPAPDFPLCVAPADPNLIYAGSDTICEGDAAELTTSATGDLQWYLDGEAIAGENSSNIMATQAGTYTVEAINCICKTMSSASQTIFVNPLPETPILTQNGNSLQVDPTNSEIFWYKDGEIFASNTTVIDNLDEGTYTVMFKNECGDNMSEPIQILRTSSIAAQLETGLVANPNPFRGSTQITLTLAESANMSLIAYNALGEQVSVLMEGKKAAGQYVVPFDVNETRNSDGVYFVKLMIEEDEAQVLKLVEIK